MFSRWFRRREKVLLQAVDSDPTRRMQVLADANAKMSAALGSIFTVAEAVDMQDPSAAARLHHAIEAAKETLR